MTASRWKSIRYRGCVPFYEEEDDIRDWMKKKAAEVESFNRETEEEFDALPEIPDYDPALSDEENGRNIDESWERTKAYWGKGSRKAEWDKWREEYSARRSQYLREFDGGDDYSWEHFMMGLHLKLQFMTFYFENLGYCESNAERAREMHLASSLLEIILCKGYDYGGDDLPYVNYRNAHRFEYIDVHGEHFSNRRAEVRFRKAYSLYFEWVKARLMTWAD